MERVCKAFRKNLDGSWTCLRTIDFSIPGLGELQPISGVTFKRGELFRGFDIAAWLDRNCRGT
jgi:hypothetical protein